MAEWRIEPLDRTHEREAFCCGKAPLDEFLRTLVGQYERRKLGRTYVAVLPEDKRILGYYTLAASSVLFASLPAKFARKLPKHPLPVVLLARLAVDQSMQGQRLGEVLLFDALQRCLALSAQLGLCAVEVLALDESAQNFYQKYGFTSLLDSPLHLYLSMKTIADHLEKSDEVD